MTSSPASESLEHARFAVVDVETTGVRAQVGGRPRFGDVVAGFGRALDAAVFVAHNARFDWRFLAAEYTLAGVPAPGGKPLCTVRLTRRLVPELRHRGLDHVAAFFGVENPARHRAFGDALATAHVLRALIGRARERGVETLEQLIEVHDRPRHGKRRNAEGETRNSSECVRARETLPDSSAFRVPPSDF